MTSRARNDNDARTLLAQHLPATPLVRAASLSGGGRDVYLKIETGLPTGSFKVRGAIYSLSVNAARRPIAEVVAASTGNHGAAVAYAGSLLNVPATIFLPLHSNPVKAARIREFGGRIIEYGADLSAAIDAADDYASRTGAFFLHDAADADIPIGTATIGAEIVEQLPAVDVVYVPIGDTALIRGVASALKAVKPAVRVVGVVAERAPAYFLSWRANQAIETATADTIADGLAVRRALAANVTAIRSLVDDVRTVAEEELRGAIEWLMTREDVAAEPAGAAATASFLRELRLAPVTTDACAVGVQAGGDRAMTCVLLVTGGNLAPGVTALPIDPTRRGPIPPP
jgi:threonine dehydratase